MLQGQIKLTMRSSCCQNRMFSSSALGGASTTSSASRTANATASSAAGTFSNPFAAMWRLYSASLQRRPLPTKMAAAVFIFTCSDLATQYITWDGDQPSEMSSVGGKRKRPADKQQTSANEGSLMKPLPTPFEFNIQRALSASSFGVVGTIYLHYWWNFLERFVNSRFPISQAKSASRLTNTAVKVLIDQSISAPLYNWCYFFITNAVHSHVQSDGMTDRLESAASKATEMIGPLMLKHWRVWPAIHGLNFYFTPVQNRVLVQNLVLVGWSGYLSHLNHSREIEEKEQEELDIVDEVLEEKAEVTTKVTTKVIHKRRPLRLRRKKTIITGIDVAEVDVEDEKGEAK